MDVAAPELLMQLFLQYGAMQGGGIIQGTINGRPIVQPVPVQLQMSAVQKREQERLAQQREQVARRLQRVTGHLQPAPQVVTPSLCSNT